MGKTKILEKKKWAKNLNRHDFQRRYISGQYAHEVISCTWREMSIKTTMRHHSTPTRMAVIKEDKSLSADSGKCWRNWIYHTLWWEWKTGQWFWKPVWLFLKKFNRVITGPSNFTPRYTYPTRVKPHIHTKTHTYMFPAASCIMAKCANNSTVQQIMSG